MDTNRRDFIRLTAATSAGFTINIALTACTTSSPNTTQYSPQAWLTIRPDDRVFLTLPKVEMGQDVITAIPKIIAEELDLGLDSIEVVLADADPNLGQLRTSGSSSIRELWGPLRQGAAQARTTLVLAASQVWNTDEQDLITTHGRVINKLTNNELSYGKLAGLASSLPTPQNVILKEANNYQLIGKSSTRLNARDIVTGRAQYGIDTTLDNLHYAAIKHAPSFDTTLVSVNKTHELKPGIKGIVELKRAVVVVATSFSLAQNALNSLDIEWFSPSGNALQQAQIEEELLKLLDEPGKLIKSSGDEIEPNNYTLRADYQSSYQAHACLEPMNCTAHIHDGICKIWAPTQHPMMALAKARETYHSTIEKWSWKALRKLGISDNVKVKTTLIGGGFGRRLEQDFVIEAINIARHFKFPVKLIWTREEDIRNDFYRPYSAHRLQARITKGVVSHWKHSATGASRGKIASSSISSPYDIPHRSLHFTQHDHGIPIGLWRSVSHSNQVFATESFLDELAHKENLEPFNLRQTLLANHTRASKVLAKLKTFSKWHKGKQRTGLAFNAGFNSYIALTIQLKEHSGALSIASIHCVVDCGIVIDPDGVKAQIEGGIIYGLNAATGHSITIKDNSVEQGNFDTYPLLRMHQIPQIHIALINSNAEPSGVGEIAVPVVAPALANAVFSTNGHRNRKVPFDLIAS